MAWTLVVPLVLLAGTTLTASREPRSHQDCAEPEEHPCSGITGLRQSPIYIDTCRAAATIHRPLRITNLDRVPRAVSVENDGRLLLGDFSWSAGHEPTVSGGGLRDEFVLVVLEVLWGDNSSSGSEHVLDGRRYAGELHLGFRNTLYPTLDAAFQQVGGFLGLAVLLDEDTRSPGRGITALAPALFEVEEPFIRAELRSPPVLRELLPEDWHRYVQYDGSGTTGGDCPDVVTWIVFLTPIRVLPIELELLRALRTTDGHRLCSSVIRPLQPVHGRRIQRRGRTPGCQIPWP